MMRVDRVIVVGRDAALWLSASVIRAALAPSGISVAAIELPSALTRADVYATLPPLEALHTQLRIDEAALLRATGGCFTLGQSFVDWGGSKPGFLHAYGACGTPIDGRDFFAYWLKARGLGLRVGLEDFSLTASAARQGRLLIPDDETETYGRSDYGYHLPAADYVRCLKSLAVEDGVTAYAVTAFETLRNGETGDIAAIAFGEQRIDGDLFLDATGDGLLIGDAMGVARESWARHFTVDRVLVATAPKFATIPAYAEIRAWEQGWVGLYPTQAQTHVVQAYASALCGDAQALRGAAVVAGLGLDDAVTRVSEPGRRLVAWKGNCVAIGGAACSFDPIHNVDLHAIQIGLIQLLAFFPASADPVVERAEYVRVMRSSFERIRDFQSVSYLLNPHAGPAFWARARQAEIVPALAHRIALFQARGEIAPYEEESFAPDSWRALFVGLGLTPNSYVPAIDRTVPETMKAQFRTMLGFVREHVLRQPTHDAYLATMVRRARG